MDIDALSPSQREALNQLQAITDGGDPDVAISVLESVNWDVQRAANVIFDPSPSAPLSIPSTRPSTTPTVMDTFELDDSEQGLPNGRPAGRSFRRAPPPNSLLLGLIARPLRFILTIIAFPFQLLRAFFRILHIPLPRLPFTLSSLSIYYRAPLGLGPRHDGKTDPRSMAERWVRGLEEETGATSLVRGRIAGGEGTSSSVGPSGSTLTARQAKNNEDGSEEHTDRHLPEFFLGSYEEFARTCAREDQAKIGCVILVSEEHDDVAEFKRSTLTDPTFVRILQENECLVWGGDIRDRDAWSASQKLQATTYPFVAFIALQPRRGPISNTHGSTPTPTLTILSRHQGPSIPSASGPTSAHNLVKHLNEQLLPRVNPILTRIRTQALERDNLKAMEAAQREAERALRAEQDRAFEESRKKDKERIEAKMAEQRRSIEEARQREVLLQKEQEAVAKAEAERVAWEEKRMNWRRWGRRALVPREPRPGVADSTRGRTIRVGVRMPDGTRGVRFFGEGDLLTAVYAYVDTMFIPDGKEYSTDSDPTSPPEGFGHGEEALVRAMRDAGKSGEKWWAFKLVLAYPRREIDWESGKRLGDVEGLKGGGQVVVEMIDSAKITSAKGKGKAVVGFALPARGDDEGYDTEESD